MKMMKIHSDKIEWNEGQVYRTNLACKLKVMITDGLGNLLNVTFAQSIEHPNECMEVPV